MRMRKRSSSLARWATRMRPSCSRMGSGRRSRVATPTRPPQRTARKCTAMTRHIRSKAAPSRCHRPRASENLLERSHRGGKRPSASGGPHDHGDPPHPSTILNTLDPLRVIFRRALRLREVNLDPRRRLICPLRAGGAHRQPVGPGRPRAVDALPEAERALWATALFCGLRRGELRALRSTDVDLAGQPAALRVARTRDDTEGELQEAKTEARTRTVAVPALVASFLAAHGLHTRRDGRSLVFGRTADLPFMPSTIRRRALDAWGERYVCTHQARHAAASFQGHHVRRLAAGRGQSQPYVSHGERSEVVGCVRVRAADPVLAAPVPEHLRK